MVSVPINQCATIALYLLAIIGMSLSVAKLSSVVAKQAIVVALQHLDNGPRKLSLIERRRIDAARAAPPLPEGSRTRVTALERPSMPANILAARLDLAEKEEIEPEFTHVASAAENLPETTSHSSSIAVRVYSYEMTTGSPHRPQFRAVRSNSTYAVSVRDVFNRSFGVLSVAAK